MNMNVLGIAALNPQGTIPGRPLRAILEVTSGIQAGSPTIVPAIPSPQLPPGRPSRVIGTLIVRISRLPGLAGSARVADKVIGISELLTDCQVHLMNATRGRNTHLEGRPSDHEHPNHGHNCLSHFHLP